MRRKSSRRDSGLWPTPTANDDNKSVEAHLAMKKRMGERDGTGANRTAITSLQVMAKADAQGYFETSELSTEPSTEEQPLLPGGFLASHFPRPGSAEARRTTATSGMRCSELFESASPLGLLRRMLTASRRWSSSTVFLKWTVGSIPEKRWQRDKLVWVKCVRESGEVYYTRSWRTFARQDTPSRHSLFQLAPSTPSTDGTDFGLWATPRSGNIDSTRTENGNPAKDGLSLSQQVRMWRTPTAEDSADREFARNSRNEPKLSAQVKMWPTPGAGDISTVVGPRPSRTGRKTEYLSRTVNTAGGSLNPTWVEWLMGYPEGWTALKDSATPSSRRSRTKSSG